MTQSTPLAVDKRRTCGLVAAATNGTLNGNCPPRPKTSWLAGLFVLAAAMLAPTILAPPTSAAVFEPEVIAWWQFEPGSFLLDSSDNGLTLSTAGTSGSSGAVLSNDTAANAGSGSAYFGGNAIMQTVGTLNLAPYDHIALSWWQKVESTTTAILWEQSINYNANTGAFIGVVNEPDYTPAYVGLRGSGDTIMDTFPYANSTWQHFTAQINLGLPGNNHEAVKIYQDGKLVGTDRLTTGTQPASFRNDRLFLGARSGFVVPLQGWLDEVKVEKVSSYVNDVANHANLGGYWRLGESAGTTAWEVNGAVGTGTYVNTTASDYSRPGAVSFDLDTAMRFNGVNSYVDAGNDASLNGAWDGVTVAAWIKPESAALTSVKMIAGKWANEVDQDHFGLLMVNGKVVIAVADGLAGEGGLSSATALQPDEWYFVAGTWDAATRDYRVYINGELDATGTQSGNGINTGSTTTMKIGAQATSHQGGRYFLGLIDEVAVFNTALGGEELMAYYRTAMVPEPSGVLMVLVGLLCLLGRRRRR